MASAMHAVSITSGIRMRVKRNRPKHVAMHKPGVEARSPAERPRPERGRQPGQRDGRQHHGNARGPIVDAENLVTQIAISQ